MKRSGIYDNIKCSSSIKPKFTPQPHQIEAMNAFISSQFKGMLLYHKLGSGKTCTSLMISDAMLEKKLVDHVYILSPGSLRSGWISEYCDVCGEDKKKLEKNYTFITYNYMVGNHLPDFDKSLVIIDEVHNLINGAKNISIHPTAIYNTLMKSNCRILALSGTPVYNYVFEFSLLGNLLKPGGFFPEIRQGKTIISQEFMKFFIEDEDGSLKPNNETSMFNKLNGIISYFPGAGKEFVPQVIEEPILKVQMSLDQEMHYWARAMVEDMCSKPPSPSLLRSNPKRYKELQKLYIMAKKHVITRSASNFYYPEDIEDEKDLLKTQGGWIDKEKFINGKLFKTYSMKITALITNIVMHNKQKHVLFTFFKEKAGVYLLNNMLKLCNIKSEIFSGDLDDKQRAKLLKDFNSDKNKYGNKIRLLLVTEAGAEGISVLNARHMHILESSPRMSKTIQAIGRVARFRSHIMLPVEERNIKVWRYWSVATPEPITITVKVPDTEGVGEENKDKTFTIINKKTIDEILYEKGLKTIKEIKSFQDILKNASVTDFNEDDNPIEDSNDKIRDV